MPYLADFKCISCGKTNLDIMFKNYEDFEKRKNDRICECGGQEERIMISPPAIEIKEGYGAVSSKPGYYWDRAERIKQSAIRKRNAQEKEKIFYKDPETIKRIENKKKNSEMMNE